MPGRTSMAGINHFAAERFAHAVVSSPAAEGRRKPRSLTAGAPIRAALLGWLVALLVGAGSIFAGGKSCVMGTVADSSQAPVPGARVTLVAADDSRQSVVADQKGHYSFPSVEPGTYTLSAQAAGYQAGIQTAVPVAGGNATTVDLHLIPTASPAPVQPPPAPPSYYDDTSFKASAVKTTIDAAGYSSQA